MLLSLQFIARSADYEHAPSPHSCFLSLSVTTCTHTAHARAHARTYAHTHTHTHTHTHIYTHTRTHAHTHSRTHARTHTHARSRAHTRTHTHTHTHTHKHTHARTHARTHAHTHTHTEMGCLTDLIGAFRSRTRSSRSGGVRGGAHRLCRSSSSSTSITIVAVTAVALITASEVKAVVLYVPFMIVHAQNFRLRNQPTGSFCREKHFFHLICCLL